MGNNSTSLNVPYFNPALTYVREDIKAIISIVGRNTERLKREKGLSYAEMSRAIGCSPEMIYFICTGKRDFCSIALLSAIAHYFGYTLLDWLREPLPDGDVFRAKTVKKVSK